MYVRSRTSLTVLSAIVFPAQILFNRFYFIFAEIRMDGYRAYRRPNPKTTLLGSKGILFPGVGKNRSGLKISGSGNSAGSCMIHLKKENKIICLSRRQQTLAIYHWFAATTVPAGRKYPLYESSSVSKWGMPSGKGWRHLCRSIGV